MTTSSSSGSPKTARPFLKWVGGKTQLLPEITARMPQTYNRYFEPFIGGGALFFHLQPPQATLTDINEILIATYQVIRDRVEELIEDLGQHRYEKDYYYALRAMDRNPAFHEWSDVQKASRLIYLNKCCFNGLYRVNSKGEFNVPFGRYKSPKFLDVETLNACHQSLQGIRIQVKNFLAVEDSAQPGDFVYFDPPYAPLSATSNFTSYSESGFGTEQQLQLRDLCDRLDQRGVYFMVSNSSAPLILDLYQQFHVDQVLATRSVNSLSTKRGKVAEVIITNTPHERVDHS